MDGAVTTAGGDVFALTDEQIVGLEAADGERETQDPPSQTEGGAPGSAEREKEEPPSQTGGGAQGEESAETGVAGPQQPPEWLAARMQDPRNGEEAKEFWDGKQRAEKEAAAYREVFATPEDARALKEIYPGGVVEAKSTAERARALDEIDAAIYRGDAAARLGLAQRMMAQDPAAFRAMVEAGVELLKKGASGEKSRSVAGARDDDSSIPVEVVRAYGEMEKAANAELEKSVGAAIGRAMERALPNLRQITPSGQVGTQHAAPLQERLAEAVREEVDAALKSDRELGEQVTRVLEGRRFDEAARGQVVRLIDARAQQLVPGAVKKVVASWTAATLAARGKSAEEKAQVQNRPPGHPVERAPVKSARERAVEELENTGPRRGRRLDYARVTDEEILGM